MNKTFRSRKWILALLIYAAATAFAGYKLLDGAQLMIIYSTLFGAYTAANVIESKKKEDA